MMVPILDSSLKLLTSGPATDSDLRRACSAAYYALFDHIAARASDLMVGPDSLGFTRARLQIYRSIDHGNAVQQCRTILAQNSLLQFPAPLANFARAFNELQLQRIRADYDPSWACTERNAFLAIEPAEAAISEFNTASAPHQRAFCIFLMAKRR
jgi:hypothetical protein